MALLDWINPAETELSLDGDGVRLRPPRQSDFDEWARLRGASRAFLQPWEPTWPPDDLTRPAFRRRLAAYAREREAGQAYRFFVFQAGGGRLVGGVSLSNVRRGVAQSGTVGYWVGEGHARCGYTYAGVQAVVRFAFDLLGLHRVEAACVPENERSQRLLLKAGFDQEGYAREYLKIDGVWRDHLLFGLVRPGREAVRT